MVFLGRVWAILAAPEYNEVAFNQMTQSQTMLGEAAFVARKIASWIPGVLGTLIGATLTVGGLLVQKYAHQRCDSSRGYYLNRWWQIGLLIFLVGQVVCFLAQGLANQTLLAAFNCWNIAVAFVLAPVFFGEYVSRGAVAGAGMLVLGSVWVILVGPKETQEQTVQTVLHSVVTPMFTLLMGGTLALGAAVGAPILLEDSKYKSKSPLWFTILSAICAWYAVLCTKATSLIMMTGWQSEGTKVFLSLGLWVMLAGAGICAAMQLHCLNMALKAGDAIQVLPIYESLSMIGQIIMCGVLFEEFKNYSMLACVWLASGVGFVLLGVFVVSRFTDSPQVIQGNLIQGSRSKPGTAQRSSPLV